MYNNLEKLSNKLKHLAKHHAHQLNHQEQKTEHRNVLNVRNIVYTVLSLEHFKDLDTAAVLQEIDHYEVILTTLLNCSILIPSKNGDKWMPVTFDAILEVLVSSNEIFRQQYFQQLMDIYYDELCECVKQLDYNKTLSRVDFAQQIKILLPLVKLQVARQWTQDNGLYTQKDKELLLINIRQFFKYPVLNQEDIYEAVKHKLNSSNYNLLSYELLPLDQKNGHLGEYFKLKVQVSVEENIQKLNLFVKLLTPKSDLMKKLVASGPSIKEDFFYMTYLPTLEKNGLGSLLDFAPRCYFSRVNDVLIMDDIAADNFVAVTPNTQLDYDGLKNVVKKMAKFHSSTMILETILSEKEGKPVTVNDLYEEYLKEVLFIPDQEHFFKQNFDSGVETIVYVTTKFPDLTKSYTAEFLKKKVYEGWHAHFSKVKKSNNFKNTICHGDMYVANMLFKLNKLNICEDVRLIDFQLIRYCPPTHDLLFFLYQNCSREIRNKHLGQLCELYYNELGKNIRKFGFDIEHIYAKKDFDESLKYMRSQGVIHALYYSPVIMVSPKLREELFSNQEKASEYLKENRWKLVEIGLKEENYRSVLRGLVTDFIEICKNGDL